MTATTKPPKSKAKAANRYNLSPEHIAKLEREFRRLFPRSESDREEAELLRIARRGFGLER